jgi:putative ABC transport system permease protein
MLQNNLKIALRNLNKHRFFTLLNVMSLAIGISACMTVIMIIRNQMSFDNFHADRHRIYRVNTQMNDGDHSRLATSAYPLGAAIKEGYASVEAKTSVIRNIYGWDLQLADGQIYQVSGFMTEPSFFDMFSFDLEVGDRTTALLEPNSVVLSKQASERYFNGKNPMGQVVKLHDKGAFTVTGVLSQPPGRSHLEFDVLVSSSSMRAIEAANAEDKIIDNWQNLYMSHTYVRLARGQSKTDLERDLAALADVQNKDLPEKDKTTFFVQRLDAISPLPELLGNESSSAAPMFFIWGFSVFVLILTIFPCLNYANMAISRLLSRTREMGVRKAIGAQKSDLRRLFLAESVLTALMALGVASVLHLALNQKVIRYFPPEAKLEGLRAGWADWSIFVLYAIGLGLLAGWIPAQRITKIQAALAIRGNSAGEVKPKRQTLRSAMLTGQFALSLVLMIVVATLWSQMRFMTLSDYGFQKENLLTVELQGNEAKRVGAELMQNPQVLGVAATSVIMAGNNLHSTFVQAQPGAERQNLHCAYVDGQYVPVMQLKLLAGQNFPEGNHQEGLDNLLIINEKAVAKFGFENPSDAVGKTLWLTDTTPARITGVLADFHYRSFEGGIEPFGLVWGAPDKHLLQVRIAPGDPVKTMSALAAIWKRVDPVHEFKATFMEASMQDALGGIQFVGGLVSFFALLCLTLACMGLLGMVTYSVGSRIKEIGIRKVMGASVREVTLQLSKRYLWILGVAILIALPAGYALSNLFLSIFAFRINVNVLILGGSALVLLALALLAVFVQAGRAAMANPVDSLRSE